MALLLLACASSACWAGPNDFDCDPAGKTFTYTASDERTNVEPTGDCHWNNGTDIVVHFVSQGDSAIQTYTTVSIWVNEAKWVDSAQVDQSSRYGEKTYLRTTRIKIDEKGMTVCQATVPDENNTDEDTPHGPEECQTHASSSLPHERDQREFPEKGQEKPLPPTMSVTHADDERLCAAMLAQLGTRLWNASAPRSGQGNSQKDEIAFPDINGSGLSKTIDLKPTRWDIENTGHPLWVTYLSGYMLSHLIFEYYAFDDDAYKRLQASERRPEDLARYATRIFPDSLGYCPSQDLPGAVASSEPCYTSAQDVWDMFITPATFRGVNYLLLNKTDDFIAVVKPLRGGKYQEPCQFQMARVEP